MDTLSSHLNLSGQVVKCRVPTSMAVPPHWRYRTKTLNKISGKELNQIADAGNGKGEVREAKHPGPALWACRWLQPQNSTPWHILIPVKLCHAIEYKGRYVLAR